jgi:hypothetical protein
VERIRLPLSEPEYRGVTILADRELRSIPDQARSIIRQALRQAGLLDTDGQGERIREAADVE